MPDTTDFDIRPSASPRTADERAAILADPGFGKHLSLIHI